MTWPHGNTPSGLTTTVKAAVLLRDGYRCHLCGLPGATQVDHITPRSQGGSDHPSNLAAIHDNPCHRRKSALEGAAAARTRHPSTRRPPERHPGLI